MFASEKTNTGLERFFLRVPEHIVFLLFAKFCIFVLFWSPIFFCLLFLLFYVIRSSVHTVFSTCDTQIVELSFNLSAMQQKHFFC